MLRHYCSLCLSILLVVVGLWGTPAACAASAAQREVVPIEGGSGDESAPTPPRVPVVVFWGDVGCSSCNGTQSDQGANRDIVQFGPDSGAEALTFLRSLADGHPGVEVTAYEIWLSPTHVARFTRVAATFGVEAAGVPMIFIGNRVWEGFSADAADEMTVYIQHCLDAGCPGPLDQESSTSSPGLSAEGSVCSEVPPTSSEDTESPGPSPAAKSVTLPLVGTVTLGGQPLWAGTALISLADSLNPCSLWALSILISIVLVSGSGKRIFAAVLAYLVVTAGVTMASIAGLFTFLPLVRSMGWIQAAVSLPALIFATIAIRDYFRHKDELPPTISEGKTSDIRGRPIGVLNVGDSFWVLIGATATLGVGVALVEAACSAGGRAAWANLLAAQDVSPPLRGALLLLYVAIRRIDVLAILAVAVLTLKAGRLEEKHRRGLKLIGGVLMLVSAIAMLLKPALMDDLRSSLLVLGGALAVSAAVVGIHCRRLPQLGIEDGTDLPQ